MKSAHNCALLALAAASLGALVGVATVGRGQGPGAPVADDTAAMIAAHVLPDPRLTPGAVLTTDLITLQKPGYAKSVRNVNDAEKEAVYKEYGIAQHAPHEYEVDHLISLTIGGSNQLSNLWPELMHVDVQGYDEGAATKDLLEDHLHLMLLKGQADPATVQKEIASDWRVAYHKYLGAFPTWKATVEEGKP